MSSKDETYSYDALNRRVASRVVVPDDPLAEKRLEYVYDGPNLIEQHQTLPSPRTLRFLHGFGVDEHIAMDEAGTVHYLLQDRLGSVVALVDTQGIAREAYLYQPYGAPTVVHGGVDGVVQWGGDDETNNTWGFTDDASDYGNPFLFTGQPFDANVSFSSAARYGGRHALAKEAAAPRPPRARSVRNAGRPRAARRRAAIDAGAAVPCGVVRPRPA